MVSIAVRYEGIAHLDLEWAAPVEPAVVEAWIAALGAPPTVLDLGCGNGAWLRALVRAPGQTGIGIDRAPDVLAVARQHPGPIEWIEADDAAWLATTQHQAALVLCVGAEHLAGGWAETVALVGRAVAPGGRLLLGTTVRRPHPIWDVLPSLAEQVPTPEALDAALSGWATLRRHTFGRAAFERYDRACRAAVDAHLATAPHDPRAADLRLRNTKGRLFFEVAGFDALAFELRLLAAS